MMSEGFNQVAGSNIIYLGFNVCLLRSLERTVSCWNRSQHVGWHAALFLHRSSRVVPQRFSGQPLQRFHTGSVVEAVFQSSLCSIPADAGISWSEIGIGLCELPPRAVSVCAVMSLKYTYLWGLQVCAKGTVLLSQRPETRVTKVLMLRALLSGYWSCWVKTGFTRNFLPIKYSFDKMGSKQMVCLLSSTTPVGLFFFF